MNVPIPCLQSLPGPVVDGRHSGDCGGNKPLPTVKKFDSGSPTHEGSLGKKLTDDNIVDCRDLICPVTPRPSQNAATIGCTKGTGFQSTGGGRLGTRLQYQTCSTNARSHKTTCHLCVATSRKAGSGCAAALTRRVSPLQARDPKRQISWCRSQPKLFPRRRSVY